MSNIDFLKKQLDILEKQIKPFKSWKGTHMIYPGGVPDKDFPKGYEGAESKYVHPQSVGDQMWEEMKLKETPGKTSKFSPRTGYTHVKIEDLKKQLDNFIDKLER